MKVFYSTDFKGLYPVGTAAVVVAESEQAARLLLDEELERIGLKQSNPFNLKKLPTRKKCVLILQDGDY